ncbi:hypothetical protein MTX78_05610 [Hymenobacter tibetensis]|uniref:Uncharacterized protein n=1 Tax=Hymenobacter tibetensis TaxID=497967 RepID=A0ABY4D226_9BACT|nr:hypothetical protein [Hymenobacter tibetensis]UOG76077.1 hypothetical protein MTX78_05610 [Hymenobacter tibetensis]
MSDQPYSSLHLCFPHIRWMVEEAFQEWQQASLTQTNQSRPAKAGLKSAAPLLHVRKTDEPAATPKQATRAEQRYRRR